LEQIVGEGLGESAAEQPGKSTGRVIAAATGLMIFAIALSRILGFVRESLLMAFFGQGALTDVYKQSFIIPDTLYFLIAGGALSSAFIPVFTKYFTENNEEDAWKTFSIVCSVAFLVTVAFVVIGEIWAVPLSRLVSPGFIPEQVHQMAKLTRIVLPAQIFFFMGGLMMGSLYSRHKFIWPALGPLIYTVGIIAGGLISAHFHRDALRILHSPEIVSAMRAWVPAQASQNAAEIARLTPTMEYALRIGTPAVSGYSWGALVGAFVGNFLVQVIAMRQIGMRFRPSLDVAHAGARKVFALMLPVILGLSLPQVDVQINKYFASMLNSGSVTALDNANRLMQVPYGVLGTSFAIALFPTLSALAAQRLWGDYRLQISQGIRRVTFMSLPTSVLLMVLSVPAVRLVFQHGRLVTGSDVNVTALTLILFAIGVPMWCLQAIIARGFYALQDTLTVVITGTIMTVIFVGLSVGFVHVLHNPRAIWWAPAGLALITSIAAGLHSIVLIWILRNRIGGIDGRRVLSAVGKMAVSCLAMAAVTVPLYLALDFHSPIGTMLRSGTAGEMKRILATGFELGFVGGIGLLVYAVTARALKLEELDHAMSMFLRKFRRKASVPAS
jgi:putative peptidoglycan lipid II flippase